MSLDVSQFSEVFFEEASDHLGQMEELLLSCDVNNPDAEDLNAIFRAAHSIKGGAGAFGFIELTSVTHVLETLLDRVRKKELPLRTDMVDAFLRARDVLASMIAAYRESGELPHDEIAVVTRALEALTGGGAAADPLAGAQSEPGSGESVPQESEWRNVDRSVTPPSGCLQVRIAAGSDIDDEGVLSCLNSYGKVIEHQRGDQEMPWRYVCETGRSAADIHETLTFMINPDRLTIDGGASDSGEKAEIWAEEGDGYGFFVPVSKDGKAEKPAPAARAPQSEAPADASPATKVAASAPAGSSATERAGAAKDGAAKDGAAAKAAAASGSSIRVSVEKVDQLLNLVGELVITQSMLAQTAIDTHGQSGETFNAGINQLERNSRELQEAVMSIRMLPVSSVFHRFPRVVRDLARQLGKEVDLLMEGENTELDKGFIEKLTDPMMHLVRNSVDHGIELPDVRVQKGKSRTGRLTLRAYQQGSDIAIEVSDDGAGLNRERILAKARENGLPVTDSMSDREAWLLIFEPGFSTAAEVTDVSGRGVGMDVVRRNIQEMGGRIEIESVLGEGTTLTIRLPLTLAILDGMSVRVGDERYIVPLAFIIEAVMPAAEDIQTVQGTGRVVNVRGEFLPLMSLAELFVTDSRPISSNLVLILKSDTQKVALLVDELLGQHQVVIKSLDANYRRVPGVAGATIMGDGRVALILDVMSLIMSGRNNASVAELASL